jgi:uncharacterized oligopeptide transporter (OPT) family protein
MALFQKPARTPADIARGRPLDISPTEVAALDEDEWYRQVFRGDEVPQLTLRTVVMGSLLGFLLAFTNLYVGLKTGWGLGVAITACIVSFALWNACLKVGLARTPLSILESNCLQSTASAAGYSTGSTMVSATPALLLLSVTPQDPAGHHLPWAVLAGWTFFLAMLGVALAVPMKRNMINQERLRFPSGIAAAVTLQSLFNHGREATAKAKALFYAALVASVPPIIMDLPLRAGTVPGTRDGLVPDTSPIFNWLPSRGTNPKTGAAFTAADWNILLDNKLVMIAAGALTGPRICLSMVASGVLLCYWLGPAGLTAGAVHSPAHAWREIGVWVGAPMMIAAGLLSFAVQGRTLGRALRSLGTRGGSQSHAAVEVPGTWFAAGALVATVGVLAIGHMHFGIPWHLGLFAVLLTFFLSLVACRATGESDITPIGALGKVTQLVYGVLIPQNATANLMTASITANAAASSADLLTDLKSGYLLGAHPRRQFVAQFLGIFAGTAATVLGFRLLVPDATALTGTSSSPAAFPAPAAQAWLAVAQVFQKGLQNLHPMARTCIWWGLAAGALLVVIELALPKYRKWLPSPTGLGLGFILPFFNPFSMLLGASAAWLWSRRSSAHADRYVVPVASGIIAGESIVSVGIALVNNLLLRH